MQSGHKNRKNKIDLKQRPVKIHHLTISPKPILILFRSLSQISSHHIVIIIIYLHQPFLKQQPQHKEALVLIALSFLIQVRS